MIQVTVIDSAGTRYPIAWFALTEERLANSFASELRGKWQGVVLHEIQSAVMNGVLVPRICFNVNGD